ncbi:MAG TPA: STAS domain-containing protein [Actinospica sp.]|nr:STAS domain-containing protein [Actinospica sp.]
MTLQEEARDQPLRTALAPDAGVALGRQATIRFVEDDDEHEDGPVHAVMTGELDLSCARVLTTTLCEAVEAHPTGLRLDLSAVTFCGCSTLRPLFTARFLAGTLGRTFTIGPYSSAVARILELSGSESLLHTP